MDATYSDIYVMKGWEYLLVIAFLVALVFFWRYLNAPAPETARRRVRKPVRAVLGDWFRLPSELFFHPGHTWAQPEMAGVVRIGIDDFAQLLLGPPSAMRLPRTGTLLAQGGVGWKMVFDDREIELLSPVDGEVLEVNAQAIDNPQIVNRDPYGSGWLLRVRVPELRDNLRNLLTGRIARAWLADTLTALRERLGGSLGTVLQDGGMPVSGFARMLSADRWDRVAAEFLLTAGSFQDPAASS